MQFAISQHSRSGPRPYNQDRVAYSYSKEALFIAVADGMGGHRHGELAAQLAIQVMTEAFQKEAKPLIAEPDRFLLDHINRVHEAIEGLTHDNHLEDSPRTTVVVALVQNNMLYCAHVGDSRLYHFRKGQKIFCTEDHSVVQSLLQKGLIQKEALLTHPERHKIYSCLGGDVLPIIALSKPMPMQAGDILLLCSDGLWTVLNDQDIAKILHAGSVTESVPKLLEIAESLCDATGDNMSAVGLKWGVSMQHSAAVSTAKMSFESTTTVLNTQLLGQNETLDVEDLSDDDIDLAIAEIQSAINKHKS